MALFKKNQRFFMPPSRKLDTAASGRVRLTRPKSVYALEANRNANALRKKMLPDFFSLAALTALVFFFLTTPALSCTNPAGVAGDMVYNDTDNVMQWCDGTNWNGVGRPPYIPNAVYFDGTNDWLVETPATTYTNTDRMTGSMWLKNSAAGLEQQIFRFVPGNIFGIWFTTGDDLRIDAEDGTNNNNIFVEQVSGIRDGLWHHVIFSFDESDGNFHVYIDDVAGTPTSNTSGNIPLSTATDTIVGSNITTGGLRFNGDIADLWIDFDTYLDLSDVNVRRQFIDGNGFPVDLGTDGSKPTGSAPDIFLSGDTATWHTNDGTGGGFTENGALTDALADPGENLGPTAGLVGWWKLDETSGTTATDSAGSNNGTMTGGLDATNDSVSGIINTALDFDGSVDIDTGSSSVLWDSTGPATAAAWVYARSINSIGSNILKIMTDQASDPFYLFYGTGGTFAGVNFGASTNFLRAKTNGDITASLLDNWVHVALVYDGVDRTNLSSYTLYVDGASIGTSTVGSGYPVRTNENQIGSTGNSNRWDGIIDDVRIYDRDLSAAEVLDLYNTGRACQNPDAFRGDVTYNTTHHIPQYCNNRQWKAMAAQPGDGGSCTTIGDLCADGSLFAGDGDLYVTDQNQSTSTQWNTVGGNDDIDPDSLTDGQANYTNALVAISTLPAMDLCDTLNRHGHTDWFLPSQEELRELYTNRAAIDANAAGNFAVDNYWSSSEVNSTNASKHNFASAGPNNGVKTTGYHVRCVRRGAPADCTNPVGRQGDFSYNTTHNVMTYCEGDDWKPVGVYN